MKEESRPNYYPRENALDTPFTASGISVGIMTILELLLPVRDLIASDWSFLISKSTAGRPPSAMALATAATEYASASARSLFASAVLADQMNEREATFAQALACLGTLEAKEREVQLGELRARVKAAERDGNFEEALRLAAQLGRVESR